MHQRKNVIRVAINGAGRIGRLIMRALHERPQDHGGIEIVAVNDLASVDTIAYLLQQDSVHGPFSSCVEVSKEGKEEFLVIDGHPMHCYQVRDPSKLPWKALNIDVVLECTGLFTKREQASLHLQAGAKKVLISAPAGSEVDATVVYGVNHHGLSSSHRIISNASCTTNCLAPLVKVLDETIGMESGLMTTIHASTNDQNILDAPHRDLRRARASSCSMIPTKTGAASSVGLVLPHLSGKLDGLAVRVPTMNVSLVDLTCRVKKKTTAAAVNDYLKEASTSSLQSILAYSEKPWVSVDYNHHTASCIVDAGQTRVIDGMVQVLAWYDNEWGFSNRMLNTTRVLMEAGN